MLHGANPNLLHSSLSQSNLNTTRQISAVRIHHYANALSRLNTVFCPQVYVQMRANIMDKIQQNPNKNDDRRQTPYLFDSPSGAFEVSYAKEIAEHLPDTRNNFMRLCSEDLWYMYQHEWDTRIQQFLRSKRASLPEEEFTPETPFYRDDVLQMDPKWGKSDPKLSLQYYHACPRSCLQIF